MMIRKLRVGVNDGVLRLVHHQGVKNQVLDPEDRLSDHNHLGAQDQKVLQGLQDHQEKNRSVTILLDDLIDVPEVLNACLIDVQEVLEGHLIDVQEVLEGHLSDIQEVLIDLKDDQEVMNDRLMDDPEVLVGRLIDVQEVLEDLTDAQEVIHAHLPVDIHLTDVSDLHLLKGQDTKSKAQRMTLHRN